MSGNGDPKSHQVTIDTIDNQSLGWVVICAGKSKPPQKSELPDFLNRSLQQWVETNPQKRLRSTLTIVQGGDTVAIHGWYDIDADPAKTT